MGNKFNRIIVYLVFFALLLSGRVVVADSETIFSTTIYSEQTSDIESLFRKNLSSFDDITYSVVPQGLIVSTNSNLFFKDGQTELSDSGKIFLSVFAELVKQIPNDIVVEVNYDSQLCSENIENWELTTIQAMEIEKYLIKDLNVKPSQIRSIGFGEINPNLPRANNLHNRMDFVILNYENIR